jgi:hypothetical protein
VVLELLVEPKALATKTAYVPKFVCATFEIVKVLEVAPAMFVLFNDHW